MTSKSDQSKEKYFEFKGTMEIDMLNKIRNEAKI